MKWDEIIRFSFNLLQIADEMRRFVIRMLAVRGVERSTRVPVCSVTKETASNAQVSWIN